MGLGGAAGTGFNITKAFKALKIHYETVECGVGSGWHCHYKDNTSDSYLGPNTDEHPCPGKPGSNGNPGKPWQA